MTVFIIKAAAFVALSAFITWFSWKPLHDVRSHGFYRFFVFESILALILLNVDYWFRDPFSPLQIVSWLLLIVALLLAIHGFYLLRVIGKPSGDFEQTTVLVKRGAYKYIRHPLYSSLLFLAWGTLFKDVSLPGALLVLVATVFLVLTARAEEAENKEKFGSAYADYMKGTRMFIPFIF